MSIKIVGIDLAKNVFQVCILLNDNSVQRNYKVSRAKFLHSIRQLPEGTLLHQHLIQHLHQKLIR